MYCWHIVGTECSLLAHKRVHCRRTKVFLLAHKRVHSLLALRRVGSLFIKGFLFFLAPFFAAAPLSIFRGGPWAQGLRRLFFRRPASSPASAVLLAHKSVPCWRTGVLTVGAQESCLFFLIFFLAHKCVVGTQKCPLLAHKRVHQACAL